MATAAQQAGTALSSDPMVDLAGGVPDPRVYTDQDLYQLELGRIFGRCRLDQCTHRGMRICRVDCGSTKAFLCSDHGWTYDMAGAPISVPIEADGYHGELDKSGWGVSRRFPLVLRLARRPLGRRRRGRRRHAQVDHRLQLEVRRRPARGGRRQELERDPKGAERSPAATLTARSRHGLGHAERDVHGLPGVTNNVLGEEAEHGLYGRWADLMSTQSWDELAGREMQRETARCGDASRSGPNGEATS